MIILSIILLYIYSVYKEGENNDDEQNINIQAINNQLDPMDMRLWENKMLERTENILSRVDCLAETRLCSSDDHCRQLCHRDILIDKKPIEYECNLMEGVCQVRKDQQITKKCDPKLGFISALRTTSLGHEWICLNTLPELFDDNGNLHLYICVNGTFDIDKFDANISINAVPNCQCSGNDIKLADKFIFNVPMCLPQSAFNVLNNYIRVH